MRLRSSAGVTSPLVTNESAVAQPFQTVRISPIVSWGSVVGSCVRGRRRSLGSGVALMSQRGTMQQPSRVLSAQRRVLGSSRRHVSVVDQDARSRWRIGTRRKGLLFDTAWRSALGECRRLHRSPGELFVLQPGCRGSKFCGDSSLHRFTPGSPWSGTTASRSIR
jgi:hypothetical protein